MKTYYVRWRHIPIELTFTPHMYISIDHTQVEAEDDATVWDIQLAIAKYFESINISPSDVRIESFQPM